MAYRKFAADYLFDGLELHAEKVLITDETGRIIEIAHQQNAGEELEYYRGIISPGFINGHCHLELSHLKDVIPPHTGLIEFLVSVVQKRGFTREVIQDAIEKAENEMLRNGIVAVGDICNTADALEIKSRSEIVWQSFVEVLSFTDDKSEQAISHYSAIRDQHAQKLPAPNKSVITPHAPYSISPKSFEAINSSTEGEVISIHNQENPAEDALYNTGESEYLKLFKIFGLDHSPFPVTGKSSIRSYLPYFNRQQKIFLVHNTYMPEEDIRFAIDYATEKNLKLVFCFCLNANSYIENTFPDVGKFIDQNCHIVLGTDSYSSNWQLDIGKEIQTALTLPVFKSISPQSALQTILRWATTNGANALNLQDRFGSFKKNAKPGIVWLDTDTHQPKEITARRIL